MCEILTVKGNPYGINFEKEALKTARRFNSDGAGYMIFSPLPEGKWDLKESKKFPGEYEFPKPKTTYAGTRQPYKGYTNSSPIPITNPDNIFTQIHSTKPSTMKKMPFVAKPEMVLEAAQPVKASETRFHERGSIPYRRGRENRVPITRISDYLDENDWWWENIGKFSQHIPLPAAETDTEVEEVEEEKEKEYRYTSRHLEVDVAVDEIYDRTILLENGELMVIHFRLSTSGVISEENTHPIETKNYIIIHNGILDYKKLPEGMNDSRYFANIVESRALKRKLGPDDQKKENVLLRAILEAAGGYYSVFIYSKITKQLHYFIKGEKARFFYDATGLLGSKVPARFPQIHTPASSSPVMSKIPRKRVMVT